jgi:hypothetical protein
MIIVLFMVYLPVSVEFVSFRLVGLLPCCGINTTPENSIKKSIGVLVGIDEIDTSPGQVSTTAQRRLWNTPFGAVVQ